MEILPGYFGWIPKDIVCLILEYIDNRSLCKLFRTCKSIYEVWLHHRITLIVIKFIPQTPVGNLHRKRSLRKFFPTVAFIDIYPADYEMTEQWPFDRLVREIVLDGVTWRTCNLTTIHFTYHQLLWNTLVTRFKFTALHVLLAILNYFIQFEICCVTTKN